jgi:inorganic triphosphatase YgiF
MEIEAKFRVADRAIFTSLRQLARLGPFDLAHTPGIERQHNTYFDTADRRLTASRVTLRVRDLGSRRVATVKLSLSTHAGVHTREEWEVEIGAGDHPIDWPASPARDRALAALDGAAILPLVITHTRRQYSFAARANAAVAELSLDEGLIVAGGRSIRFRELEVELLEAGTRAELDALAACLQARFPLLPEALGKKRRGMALLDQAADNLSIAPRPLPAITAGDLENILALEAGGLPT